MRLSNKILTSALIAVTAGVSQQVLADDDLWFGAKVGTLGFGLEATWRPVPYLDVRAGFNAYSFDDDRSEAGINYNADIDLRTIYATANLRVPLSPFRVTAGVFSNGNEGLLTSLDTGIVQIGGVDYDASQVGTLKVKGDFDSLAPYVGVGLDFRLMDTLGLNFDAGVMFQGSVNVVATADGPLASNAGFQAALEVERQELQSSLDDYEYYPVVSIGISFNF